AGRVLHDNCLTTRAEQIAMAWLPYISKPFYDTTSSYPWMLPYILLPAAPQKDIFRYWKNSSMPLYSSEHAAFSPDVNKRRMLQQQALVKVYGDKTAVVESDLGGEPRYYPHQIMHNGFYLTQTQQVQP